MRANVKAKPKRGAPQRAPEDDDDDMPRDIEAYRLALARRISIGVSSVLKRWRSCAEPSCKRARGCCAPRGVCGNDKPPRPFAVGASFDKPADRDGILHLKVNVPPGARCTGSLKVKISGPERPGS